MPAVIFITAYDQFAVRAFEVHAVDYLLKPFDDERFQSALDRIKSRPADRLAAVGSQLAALLADLPASNRGRLGRVVVRKPHHTVLVPIDAIDWVEAADFAAKLLAKHFGGR